MLRRDERGSTLLLMPAAVLVVVVLSALTVDLSAVHLRQRELVVAAQAAANDAAAAGLDEAAFRSSGTLRLAPGTARRAAAASLATNAPDARLAALVVARTSPAVEVRLVAEVPTVFARALPGAPRSITVTARARARLEG